MRLDCVQRQNEIRCDLLIRAKLSQKPEYVGLARGQRNDEGVAHLTPEERVARGKAARPDPVGLLEEQAASRVPELVPIRYGRMLVSPFTFAGGSRLSPQQTGCVNG